MHRPPSVHRTPSPCIARHSQCIVRRSFAPSAAYLHRTPSPSIAHHSPSIAAAAPRASPAAPCIARRSRIARPFASPAAPVHRRAAPVASPAAPSSPRSVHRPRSLHRPPLLRASPAARSWYVTRRSATRTAHMWRVPGPFALHCRPARCSRCAVAALLDLSRLDAMHSCAHPWLLAQRGMTGLAAAKHGAPLHGSTQSPARWPAQHTFASPAPHPRRCRRLCARRAGQIT